MLDHEPDTNTQPTTNAADPVDSPPPAGGDDSRTGGWPARKPRGSVIETVSSTPEHPTEEPTGPGFAGGGAAAQPPDLPTASEPPPPRTPPRRPTTSPAKKAAAKKSSRTVAEPADRAGDSTAPAPRKRAKRPLRRLLARRLRPSLALRRLGPTNPSAYRPTPVNSEDEPATVDVQASPAAELEPSGESIGVVDAEQAQPPQRWFRPATSSPL